MKHIFLLTLIAGVFALRSTAQDAVVKDFQFIALRDIKPLEKDGWKKNGTFIINANQGSLRNWASGGELNTLGVSLIFNYNISNRKGRYTWNNYFDLGLGFQNATSFGSFRKTDDHIDITSKYGYELSKKLYLATLVNFNTQALEGYDYSDSVSTKISNFLSPGKILVSLGFDYRPSNCFSLFISPVTTRWILKKDPDFYADDKFGVPPFQRSYDELGSFATAKYNTALSKWARYTGRLDLFSNYKRNPQNVDMYFTNLLALKFNKWLGTTISLDMVYDDDVIKRTQIKELLGLGLVLKM